jgi:hypothetical protein
MTIATKTCAKCSVEKPLTAYHGRQKTCIDCTQAARAKTIARKETIAYSLELGARVCEVLADTPMHMLVAMAAMPTERSIHKWRLEHPEFAEAYELARIARADSRGHKVDEHLSELKAGKLDPQTAKVLIDTEIRLAGKEHPARWGEKTVADLTLRPGKADEKADTDAWLEKVLGPSMVATATNSVIPLLPAPAKDEGEAA